MRVLLDTHFLLWWLADDPALGDRARDLISTPENLIFFSAARVWEIRIKEAIGKVDLPEDFADVLAAQAFEPLAVTVAHANALREVLAVASPSGRLDRDHRSMYPFAVPWLVGNCLCRRAAM